MNWYFGKRKVKNEESDLEDIVVEQSFGRRRRQFGSKMLLPNVYGSQSGSSSRSGFLNRFGSRFGAYGSRFGKKKVNSASSMMPDTFNLPESTSMVFGKRRVRRLTSFGKKRRSVKVVKRRKTTRKVVKKPTRAIMNMCRKLKIKTTRKVGSKRVYKKIAELKRQIKLKLKMKRRKVSSFGKRRKTRRVVRRR